MDFNDRYLQKVLGWGVLPIMAYKGRLRPKGVPFSGFRDFTRQSILSVIWVCERAQRAEQMEFVALFYFKSGKRSIFVIDSYLKGNAFTAVKRDAKFLFVNRRYTKGLPFS